MSEDAVEILRLIDYLREDEGDSVNIFCINPDPVGAEFTQAIEVSGAWTKWEDRRYSGETFLEALRQAAKAKNDHSHPDRTSLSDSDVKELRRTLQFYADEKSYDRSGSPRAPKVEQDHGMRARTLMKNLQSSGVL